MKRFWKAWGPSLLLMAIIFVLSSQSDIPGPVDELMDKLFKKTAHAIGYGMLAISYAWALQQSGVRRNRLPLALLLTLLYASSDEWHQTFVPGRTGQPLDVLIDLSGALLALGLWQRVRHRQQLDPSP